MQFISLIFFILENINDVKDKIDNGTVGYKYLVSISGLNIETIKIVTIEENDINIENIVMSLFFIFLLNILIIDDKNTIIEIIENI